MDRSVAAAYEYAEASGMLASSFVGVRLNKLFEPRTLQELWGLVFGGEAPAVPEVLLAKQVELEAERRFVGGYMRLLKSYSRPDPAAVELLRFYDYENLKEIGARICYKKEGRPDLVDIGDYSMLNWGKKDRYKTQVDEAALGNMVAGTPVSWYKTPAPETQADMDSRLDKQYVLALWESVQKLPSRERAPFASLLKEEIAGWNILWAIRLKSYYNMGREEIASRLMYTTETPSEKDELAEAALGILDYPLDDWGSWRRWKYRALLNPYEEGVYWSIDPRWVRQAAKRRVYRLAMTHFHRYPFTAVVLLTWFKIKQYEADCIRTAAEAIRLNVDKTALRDLAGVEV
ncbi:MAG: V-type ATPase subunit [Spirochaetaceae bacterium]|nr:V-type ATPase subunit [Spirochaetaceae bacterium]